MGLGSCVRYTCAYVHGNSHVHMLVHRTHVSVSLHNEIRRYVHLYIDVVHTCVCLTGHFVTQTFLPANNPCLVFPSASLSSPSSYLSPTNCLPTPVQPVWTQWRRQNHWETVCKDDPFLCWLHSPGEEEVPQETEGGFQTGRPSECKALERGSYVRRWLWYIADLISIIHCTVPVHIRTYRYYAVYTVCRVW